MKRIGKNKYKQILYKVDIKDELRKRGLIGNISNHNLMTKCPFHNDSNPSFGVRLNNQIKYGREVLKGTFNCYSCGKKGKFFDLIAHLDGITYKDAVLKYTSNIYSKFNFKDIKTRTIGKKLMNKKENKKIKVIKKSFLKKFVSIFDEKAKAHLKYMVMRGFNREVLKKHEIMAGINGDVHWKNRVIIPFYIEGKKLINCLGRYIYKTENVKKIKNVKGADMTNYVYGVPYLRKNVEKIVIVESMTDKIYLDQFGIDVLATNGLSINKEKIKHILKYTTDIILAWDGDAKYKLKKSIYRAYISRLERNFNLKIVNLPRDKDPNDLTFSEVEKYFGRDFGLKNI